MYYVGIDWADRKYDLVILNDRGNMVCPPFVIQKSEPDFTGLLLRLRKLSADTGHFKIGIETPHNLLVDTLLAWNYPVFSIHPSSMKSFRKRYRTTNARDDVYDSFVLADVMRTDKACWRKVDHGSEQTRQLRLLVVDHHKLIQKQSMHQNAFKETLKQFYPEYLDFFKDVARPVSLAFFLAFPTFDKAAKLTASQLREFFKEHHLCSKKHGNNIYHTLRQTPIPVAESVVAIKSMRALTLAQQLVQINSSIRMYEQSIETHCNNHSDYQIFSSFPGIALISSARLIAIFGDDRKLYENVAPIQMITGTCPVTEITGKDKRRKKVHKIVYFRQGCNKIYRTFVYNIAFASLTKATWTKAYYDRHRKNGHTHPHALRCLANLQLKILFAMWKNRTKFDENIYLAQKTRHKLKEKSLA